MQLSQISSASWVRFILAIEPAKMDVDFHSLSTLQGRHSHYFTHVLFSQFWIDPRLSWNKSEYDGISQVILHPEKAWLPDVMLVNRYELTIVQK